MPPPVRLTDNVHYLKFGWPYSYQAWTVRVVHTSLTSHAQGWDGVKMWDLKIVQDFDFVAGWGIRVSQTHVKFLKYETDLHE